MKKYVALTILSGLLCGCANQSDQARLEGTALGAGLGALVGGAIGGIAGRSGKSALIGAAVGAAAGGVGGYLYSDRIAKRHEELAGKENDLDARIAFARGINEDTREYNSRLKKEVEGLEPKISEIAAKKKKQEITQQELQQEKQALNVKISDANKQLAAGQSELQELKKFRTGQAKNSTDLDKEIKLLEQNLAQMKSNTSALASLNQRI